MLSYLMEFESKVNLESLQDDCIKRTRSGRICLPRLAWWAGERVVTGVHEAIATKYVGPKYLESLQILPSDIYERHQRMSLTYVSSKSSGKRSKYLLQSTDNFHDNSSYYYHKKESHTEEVPGKVKKVGIKQVKSAQNKNPGDAVVSENVDVEDDRIKKRLIFDSPFSNEEHPLEKKSHRVVEKANTRSATRCALEKNKATSTRSAHRSSNDLSRINSTEKDSTLLWNLDGVFRSPNKWVTLTQPSKYPDENIENYGDDRLSKNKSLGERKTVSQAISSAQLSKFYGRKLRKLSRESSTEKSELTRSQSSVGDLFFAEQSSVKNGSTGKRADSSFSTQNRRKHSDQLSDEVSSAYSTEEIDFESSIHFRRKASAKNCYEKDHDLSCLDRCDRKTRSKGKNTQSFRPEKRKATLNVKYYEGEYEADDTSDQSDAHLESSKKQRRRSRSLQGMLSEESNQSISFDDDKHENSSKKSVGVISKGRSSGVKPSAEPNYSLEEIPDKKTCGENIGVSVASKHHSKVLQTSDSSSDSSEGENIEKSKISAITHSQMLNCRKTIPDSKLFQINSPLKEQSNIQALKLSKHDVENVENNKGSRASIAASRSCNGVKRKKHIDYADLANSDSLRGRNSTQRAPSQNLESINPKNNKVIHSSEDGELKDTQNNSPETSGLPPRFNHRQKLCSKQDIVNYDDDTEVYEGTCTSKNEIMPIRKRGEKHNKTLKSQNGIKNSVKTMKYSPIDDDGDSSEGSDLHNEKTISQKYSYGIARVKKSSKEAIMNDDDHTEVYGAECPSPEEEEKQKYNSISESQNNLKNIYNRSNRQNAHCSPTKHAIDKKANNFSPKPNLNAHHKSTKIPHVERNLMHCFVQLEDCMRKCKKNKNSSAEKRADSAIYESKPSSKKPDVAEHRSPFERLTRNFLTLSSPRQCGRTSHSSGMLQEQEMCSSTQRWDDSAKFRTPVSSKDTTYRRRISDDGSATSGVSDATFIICHNEESAFPIQAGIVKEKEWVKSTHVDGCDKNKPKLVETGKLDKSTPEDEPHVRLSMKGRRLKPPTFTLVACKVSSKYLKQRSDNDGKDKAPKKDLHSKQRDVGTIFAHAGTKIPGKGTLKRKKVISQKLEEFNEGHCDDFIDKERIHTVGNILMDVEKDHSLKLKPVKDHGGHIHDRFDQTLDSVNVQFSTPKIPLQVTCLSPSISNTLDDSSATPTEFNCNRDAADAYIYRREQLNKAKKGNRVAPRKHEFYTKNFRSEMKEAAKNLNEMMERLPSAHETSSDEANDSYFSEYDTSSVVLKNY